MDEGGGMDTVDLARLRADPAGVLDGVAASRAPVLVERGGGEEGVVLVAASEYAALEGTVHLLRSPANAARLLRSLADAEARRLAEAPPGAVPPRSLTSSIINIYE